MTPQQEYEEALAIAREIGDRGLEASRLGNLGELALAEGNLALAHEHLDAALPLARGRRSPGCFNVIELAALARCEGRREDAARLLEDAQTLNATLGSRDMEANIYAELGRVQRDQGQLEVARQSFAVALSVWDSIGQGNGYGARTVRADVAALDAKPQPQRKRRRWRLW